VGGQFPEYENESWWAAMSQLVEASPEPGEPEETVELCVSLAIMRSEALGRHMVPLDAVIAASILCWNPFKPGPEAVYREAAGEARTALLDRKRDRRTLVYEDTDWVRASTDEILAAMGREDPNLPAQLFLGAIAGSGESGLTV